MKLEILCHDGSPLGVTSQTIWGDSWRVGVGGAELALLTMCEEWTKAGHEVILYNDPKEANASSFEQRPISAFDPNNKRDVLINFRSPNEKSVIAKGLKVWWSCDQFTVGDYSRFGKVMDRIVCISDFHVQYFKANYQIENAIAIDLPVRVDDYNIEIQKVPNRLIFTSVPGRGLDVLYEMWQSITNRVPDVSLIITSDYRLWGVGALNEQFRVKWMNYNNVSFLGAVSRAKLIEEEMKAQILSYPSTYDELFCISCAEAQVAGAFPITSETGALNTTNMGIIVDGNVQDSIFRKRFADEVVKLLNNPKLLKAKQEEVRQKAIERFSPDTILKQWNEKVFE